VSGQFARQSVVIQSTKCATDKLHMSAGYHTLSLQISEMGLMLFHLLSSALSTNRVSCKTVDGTGNVCVLSRESFELWKRRSAAFFIEI